MIQANPVQANSIFPFFLILLFKVKRKKIYYLILISKKEGLIVPGGSDSTQRMKIYCDDHWNHVFLYAGVYCIYRFLVNM